MPATPAEAQRSMPDGSERIPVAPPSKLTPEVQERVAMLIRVGNTVEIAAQATGIGRSTFFLWMNRGAEGVEPYVQFVAAVEQSRAEAEATLVTRIAKAAANGSWSAAAWLLERGSPERWAKISDRRLLDVDHPPAAASVDPFAEVDELAARRAQTP